MGILRPGDEPMHYSDSSHRWISPDPDRFTEEEWRGKVQAHLDQHRASRESPTLPGRLRG